MKLRALLTVKNVTVFLFHWLMVGFALGTATLLGPVSWITTRGREAGWGQSAEDGIVGAVIVVYVLLSAVVTLWLTRAVLRTSVRHVRMGIPALTLVCAGSALWLWMSPAAMGANMGQETEIGAHFTFGSYPTEEKMLELKQRGYTAVITLLHPVVPFEPKLLGDERRAAQEVGLELIHLPMLPWISDNAESLQRVEELARQPTGRYYVHCYLGRDRVNLVKRVVEQAGPDVTVEAESAPLTLGDFERFERGKIYRLTEGVWLTPYPTDEEFIPMVQTAQLIVSLMDPEDPDDREWVEKERELLERYRVPLEILPLSYRDFDPHRVLDVARRVWTLPRPLVVHGFLSPSTGRSPTAEAFMQAFLTNLPSLPPSLFAKPLAGGQAEVLAPNIAVGPRPKSREFGVQLFGRGVRSFIYVARPGSSDTGDLPDELRRKFDWRALASDDTELMKLLGKGGPWYLYGPGLDEVRERVAERFGPAIPPQVKWNAEAFLHEWKLERTGVVPAASDTRQDSSTGSEIAENSGAFDLRGIASGPPGAMLPGPRLVILLGPILLLVAVLFGSLAGWMRKRRGVRAPYTRKVFHFGIFTLAALLHIAAGLPAVVLFGCIVSGVVLYAVMRGDGFPFYEAMARPTDSPHRTLFIIVPLITTAVGGLLSNLLFAPVAYVGYLVGGWGDAVGEPVGTAWGRHRFKVPSLVGVPATRSLEGSTAVLFVGLLAAFLGLWAYGVAPRTAVGVALACAVTGTVVEAISNHGLDNLTIQVAASGTAFLLLG